MPRINNMLEDPTRVVDALLASYNRQINKVIWFLDCGTIVDARHGTILHNAGKTRCEHFYYVTANYFPRFDRDTAAYVGSTINGTFFGKEDLQIVSMGFPKIQLESRDLIVPATVFE